MICTSKKNVAWGAGALLLAVYTCACDGRNPPNAAAEAKANVDEPPSFAGPAVVEIDLRSGLGEVPQSGFFGGGRRSTFTELVDTLTDIRSAEDTQGLFVRFGGRLGFARAHEIGRILGEVRAKNKPVICHADDYDNATYLAASLGCSSVWVSPAGGVDTVGVAAQLLFAKSFLAKYKVDVDYLQIGKYKGAEEPFTRDAPSPEAKQSLETALGGIRTAWLDAITKGRGEKVGRDVVEDGPYSPEESKAKGLIDEIGYTDDAREAAKKAADAKRVRKRFGGRDEPPSLGRGLADVFRGMSGSGGTPHVAILPAAGAISMSGGGGLPLGGESGITERALSREIAKLTTDESTKAVVLRIDSPGGSALASDLLWSKLMKLRAEKPLVISVGGMAASGGYYLSCAGTKIVAESTSIVGSIGVVGGKLSFGRALEEYGIHAETVSATPDADKAARSAYMSIFSAWDDKTRDRVRASMQGIYDLFLARVSEGRGLPKEKVASFAEGKLFAGTQAKELGMVDELGGIEAAVKLAMELAKLPEDTPVDLVGTPPSFFDALAADESAQESQAAVMVAANKAAADLVSAPWIERVPELQTFAAALGPLVSGERVLTVTPFAISLR
ncbi:MAG: signal peptide peptidase SppA [Polyangiaceae bacterium]|nr:signal peptide peptidase SppA [Polyangiaceae bacterium]